MRKINLLCSVLFLIGGICFAQSVANQNVTTATNNNFNSTNNYSSTNSYSSSSNQNVSSTVNSNPTFFL